jgi:hypothetical protein
LYRQRVEELVGEDAPVTLPGSGIGALRVQQPLACGPTTSRCPRAAADRRRA